MTKGIFITLEGGEGTGKSTLSQALSSRLTQTGLKTLLTREPGGTALAEAVRNLVLFPPAGQSWSPLAQALLMNAARADHLEKTIRPALESGTWVICDRFADSTRAYQSIDGVELGTLHSFEHAVVGATVPAVTFILDAAPQRLLERRSARGGSDAFEAQPMAFHEQIRDAFLDIARQDPERCVVLDALLAPDQLADRVMQTLEQRGYLK